VRLKAAVIVAWGAAPGYDEMRRWPAVRLFRVDSQFNGSRFVTGRILAGAAPETGGIACPKPLNREPVNREPWPRNPFRGGPSENEQ